MSIGSSLSGITFSGIGSGIDTESIISRLIQVESVPIRRMQAQQAQLTTRMGLMSQLRGQLAALQSASNAINSAAAFQNVTATSSDTAVATVSASSGAVPGIYALEVSKLAQAHKVSSSAQSDATTALNLTGSFVVNGKGVSVVATDTLTSVAQKINEAGGGVTASIINGGTGNTYLTLSANSSGAAKKIQLANVSGSVLGSLGMISGAGSIRESVTNGATSYGFSSSSTEVGTLMGLTGLSATTITINSVNVSVDLANDSLQDIANSINAAGTGATATVRSVTADGATTYKLDIVGASTPTFADPDGTLGALGVLQSAFSSQLTAAQDAEYSLDGVDFTSATNTITTVIPNVTLTLLKADAVTPKTSTLTLTQDNAAVKEKVKEFMNAYNGIVDFIKSNSAFDKDTFAAGPLFGDAVARQVEQVLSDHVFTNVAGLSTAYTNLTQIGFAFDENGRLKLDEASLDAALAASPSAVGNLFRVRGESTGSALQYVSSSDKTKASGAGLYSVVITQIATKGSYEAELAQSSASTVTEKLTFSGALFGSADYELILPSGSDLAANIATINNDSKLKDLVVASNSGGKLLITSKKFGSNGNFSVVSDLAAAADNSGIGTTSAGVKVTGVDVAGTINGEAATGSGQFLTGDSGNANTDGLQVQYTGSTTGAIGDIRVTKGIASVLNGVVSQFTDAVSGLLTANDKALQEQFDGLGDSISSLQSRLTLKEESLRRRFAAMEEALASMQAQQSQLGTMMSNLSSARKR
jgi:flagellar hook-associated protein 2